jgi:hypothetical protein
MLTKPTEVSGVYFCQYQIYNKRSIPLHCTQQFLEMYAI